MLQRLHEKKKTQLGLGLFLGIAFGFLLQKGGVTTYDIIMGQLLLTDFTVLKIMLTAMCVGMVGVHLLKDIGMAQLHPKPGSLGSSGIGGLIFGVGFGILGYCPGTSAGATAQGNIDALVGGVCGIMIGSALLAALYPKLADGIHTKGSFGDKRLPEIFKVNHWIVIIPLVILVLVVLWWFEKAGL